ncbi:MAG: putative esterase [Enterovirga sp.]|nr:putative esterase [Enterovirga sp.]
MSEGPGKRPSLRLRLLVRILRLFVRPHSRYEPDPWASRALMAHLKAPPLGGTVRAGTVGGIPGEWASRGEPAATLLYLHGGAFVVCSPQTHRTITVGFARRGFRVFAPAYRRAPEHRFPAALDDVVASYRGLLAEGHDPGQIAVAGESAGAGLALSLLLRLRDLGLPQPAAAALFSPWIDLAHTGATMRSNAERDPMFHPDHADAVARHYLGDADPRTPLASPLYADLTGLPPLLIQAGDSELLLDDSRRLAARARAAGLDATLTIWPGVPHGWQIFGALLPEAQRSLDQAAAFLHGHLAPGA